MGEEVLVTVGTDLFWRKGWAVLAMARHPSVSLVFLGWDKKEPCYSRTLESWTHSRFGGCQVLKGLPFSCWDCGRTQLRFRPSWVQHPSDLIVEGDSWMETSGKVVPSPAPLPLSPFPQIPSSFSLSRRCRHLVLPQCPFRAFTGTLALVSSVVPQLTSSYLERGVSPTLLTLPPSLN